MFLTSTLLSAVASVLFASAADATHHCNPATLNTTRFNYVNDIENQTVHQIAKRFNRGVCDIGRANLSLFHRVLFVFSYGMS